jgi:hypothetical protein
MHRDYVYYGHDAQIDVSNGVFQNPFSVESEIVHIHDNPDNMRARSKYQKTSNIAKFSSTATLTIADLEEAKRRISSVESSEIPIAPIRFINSYSITGGASS